MLKTCSKCGKSKPVTEFYARKNRKSGLQSHCSECVLRYRRARTAQWSRSKRKACPDCGTIVSNNGTRCKSCAIKFWQRNKFQPILIPCKTCGESFKARPERKNPQFCSRQCQCNYGKIPCPVCNKLFKPDRDSRSKTNTCSRECRGILRRKKVKVLCRNCGKSFDRCPSKIKSEDTFCSQQCKQTFWRGDNHASYVSLECVCATCGKHFVRNYSKIKSKDTFCSRQCSSLSQVIPGTSEYRGPNWKEQRRKARKRDDYTCQGCGIHQKQYGKALDVHHIVPFRDFGVDNYLQANHLENLVSLCKTCHMLTERGNRTLDELRIQLLCQAQG